MLHLYRELLYSVARPPTQHVGSPTLLLASPAPECASIITDRLASDALLRQTPRPWAGIQVVKGSP
jgi:hypothetical protein